MSKVLKQLSEKQIADYRDAFMLFDKDNNGIVTSSELGSVCKALGLVVNEEQVQEMLKIVDRNSSGNVEFDDFCRLMETRMDDTQDADMKKAFKAFDLDEDGFIDEGELKSTLAGMGVPLTDDSIKKIMVKADLDGDGKLNYEEFTKQMGAGFQ